MLFGPRPPQAPARGFAFPGEAEWRRPRLHLGPKVPNPAWEHQLRAYTWSDRTPADWVARWAGHANPLEDDITPYGFSPITTWDRHGAEIAAWLAATRPPEADWAAIRLPGESTAFDAVRAWARAVHPSLGAVDDAALRELHTLTFGYRDLWLATR